MEHLAHRGLACPQPVRGRDGAALRHLCGRHAAITTFLPGVWPRRVRVEHCGPVGAALAALHRGRRRLRADADQRAGTAWLDAAAGPLPGPGDEVQPGLAAELDTALTRILAAGRRTCRAGTSTPICSPTMCSSWTTSCRA